MGTMRLPSPAAIALSCATSLAVACTGSTDQSPKNDAGGTEGGQAGDDSGGDAGGGGGEAAAADSNTEGGGGICTSDSSCAGGICGFPAAGACAAVGTCFPAPGATCLAYGPGCACDGTSINLVCNGLPTGYAPRPLLHSGDCASDAGSPG
jgi:hypothetical protein